LIRVNVRLYGELRERLDAASSGEPVSLPEGSTLETLNESLGIPTEDVVVTLVNGVAVSQGTVLREGDRVDVFPPLAGG
jgi:molybdopterin converting factor small subunit